MSTSAKSSHISRDPVPSGRLRIMLFVAGEERNSQAARANLSRICENHLATRADLEVVDVLLDHRKALHWKVLLTPATLFFVSDAPARITGTMDDPEKVLDLLGLRASGDQA